MSTDRKAALLAVLSEVRIGRVQIVQALEEIDQINEFHDGRSETVLAELRALINSPITDDFDRAVPLEAAHQVERWSAAHDAGKLPEDWFWLVGYLAGKCLRSHLTGDAEKALHHTISTAAALRNWHRAIQGATDMRPGIGEDQQ